MNNFTKTEMIVAHLELARELAKQEFESKAEFTFKLKHPQTELEKFKQELNQILDNDGE